MTLEMFSYDDVCELPSEEEFNRHIASGDSKNALTLLRSLNHDKLFEVLGRNRFTICGKTKNDMINFVQNELINRCKCKTKIELIK